MSATVPSSAKRHPAVAVAAEQAITEQEVLIWWAGEIQKLLTFLAKEEDGMLFRYYGGFALNVLEGQMRGGPPGNLQACYDIGTASIGFPASDIDVQVYGVTTEQENDAALTLMSHLDGEDTSVISFETFPGAARNWILSGMPIPGRPPGPEREHQYVMLRKFRAREAPVESLIAKIHPYKVSGVKHYQIQIAGVFADGLIDLTQISFVQTPFPAEFVRGAKVYLHDPWTLLKQFSTLYDAIKDMPGMDDKIVKTARRIEVADGMVAHFEEMKRLAAQSAAQRMAQQALRSLGRGRSGRGRTRGGGRRITRRRTRRAA